MVLKADISHACLSFAFVFWEDQYAMLWTQTNAKRKTTRFNNQFHFNNLRNSRAGRNVVNNSCSPSLISSPLYSLPPFTPSSLLHTLFITAYFPLAIAIVSHPPTNQPTPLHHSHEGWRLPWELPVISRAPLVLLQGRAQRRGWKQANSSTTTTTSTTTAAAALYHPAAEVL